MHQDRKYSILMLDTMNAWFYVIFQTSLNFEGDYLPLNHRNTPTTLSIIAHTFGIAMQYIHLSKSTF